MFYIVSSEFFSFNYRDEGRVKKRLIKSSSFTTKTGGGGSQLLSNYVI